MRRGGITTTILCDSRGCCIILLQEGPVLCPSEREKEKEFVTETVDYATNILQLYRKNRFWKWHKIKSGSVYVCRNITCLILIALWMWSVIGRGFYIIRLSVGFNRLRCYASSMAMLKYCAIHHLKTVTNRSLLTDRGVGSGRAEMLMLLLLIYICSIHLWSVKSP